VQDTTKDSFVKGKIRLICVFTIAYILFLIITYNYNLSLSLLKDNLATEIRVIRLRGRPRLRVVTDLSVQARPWAGVRTSG